MDLVYCYHFEGASFQIKSSYILDLYFFLMYRGIMIMVMVIFNFSLTLAKCIIRIKVRKIQMLSRMNQQVAGSFQYFFSGIIHVIRVSHDFLEFASSNGSICGG